MRGIFLAIAAIAVGVAGNAYAATGTVTVGQKGFSSYSTASGKIVATGPADTLKIVAGSGMQVTANKGTKSITLTSTATGTGDVTGPPSASDNALPRYSGSGGKTLKASTVTVTDAGAISAPGGVTVPQGASGQSVDLLEGSANGTNKTTIQAADSLTADHVLLLSDSGVTYDGNPIGGGASSLEELSDWPAAVTADEVGYLNGVTSGVQGQIDGKAASSHGHAAPAITYDNAVSGLAATDVKAALDELKANIASQNTLISNLTASNSNLITAMTSFGVDTTPPDLVRNAPATTTPTGTSSSLTINYTASDSCPSPPCMDATHPLQYAINGGSAVDFTSGADTVLTGFVANTPTPIVVIAKNSAGMTKPDNLTYTYQAPGVSVAPTSKAFADTNTGASSAAQTFTVTNTGLASLTLSPGLSVTGADAGHFPLSKGTCVDGATLLPSDTCTASMTFSPTTVGNKTASLLVDSNAADTTVSLSGTGTVVVTVPVMSYFNADSATSGQALSKGTGNVTVGAQVASATGQVGNGLKENSLASSDNFYFPALSNIDQAVGTLGMWVKSNQEPTGNAFLFRTTTTSPYFALRYNTANSRWFFQYRTSGGTLDLPANSFPVGTWVFAEIAWNATGNQIACRINGGSWVTASNPTASTPTGANVTFLGDINFQSYMTVDQIMISGTYQADLYSVRNQTSFP